MASERQFKNYAVGVGLRVPHLSKFLDTLPRPSSVQWLEVISENYLDGKNLQNTRSILNLEKIRRDFPIALHGVSMSLGSMHGLDLEYLKKLKALADRIEPIVISDHLCWTRIHGIQTHDLNPLPYTEALVVHVSDKIKQAQDFLGRKMLIENVSSYVTFESSVYTEEEFLARVVERADCGLLLDINNTFVSSMNHAFDAKEFLKRLPHHRVGQIHLAGHTIRKDGFLVDTHDEAVRDEVWDLFSWYGKNFGHPSSMIERDGNIPEWAELEVELLKMKSLFQSNEKIEVQSVNELLVEANSEFGDYSESNQLAWANSLFADYAVTEIREQPPLSARERFNVYEEAFWIRLNAAVSEDFIKIREWVLQNHDEETWDQWIFDALSTARAHSWTLSEVGESFLKGLKKLNYDSLFPKAFFLAEQDWARIRSHFLIHAKATGNTDFSQLQTLAENVLSQVVLTLHPSAQVLDSQKCVIWTPKTTLEKHFSSEEWKGMVAVLEEMPMMQMPEYQALIQQWVQIGLIHGWKRKQVAE
jgi:uncharacterized protein (UPF0276 family)